MKYAELRGIKRLYFGYEGLSKALGISMDSARVSANRYLKQGFLVRLKRNLYVLKERWDALGIEEKFVLVNLVQVPSYISLMTALGYYEVTTQIQRNFVESVCLKRTKEVEIDSTVFNYTKIDKRLYSGFFRVKGFFIASPEKAFLDMLYLASLNRYRFDRASIDLAKFNKASLKAMAKIFPKKTQRMLEQWKS